jgi:hypothetical protein
MREIDVVCVMTYRTITYLGFVISDDFSSIYAWNGRQLQRTIYANSITKFLFNLVCESLSWNFLL